VRGQKSNTIDEEPFIINPDEINLEDLAKILANKGDDPDKYIVKAGNLSVDERDAVEKLIKVYGDDF
jgi:hypothetical protein